MIMMKMVVYGGDFKSCENDNGDDDDDDDGHYNNCLID